MEENSTEWVTGPLVAAGSRLAIRGEEASGGFHCGEGIELEVAPGIWIRGSVELDHSLTIHRLTNGGNLTGDHEEWQGWYLNIGQHTSKLLLVPGMQARRYVGLDWPEPSTPYEGQAYKSRYGGWKRYRSGRWVKEEE